MIVDDRHSIEFKTVEEYLAANWDWVENKMFNNLYDPSFFTFYTEIERMTSLFLKCGINPLDYFKDVIPNGAFNEAVFTNNDIHISDSIKEIDRHAFQGSSITSVILSKSIKRVDEYAFYGCLKLKKVVIENPDCVVVQHAFWACDALEEITLPKQCKESYSLYISSTNINNIKFTWI